MLQSVENLCLADDVTVIIPAFNEAETVADTLKSLDRQTAAGFSVIVVDDGSTDNTGEIASAHGATVLRPSSNTGSKAGAQTFALEQIQTRYVITIDADTILAPNAIECLMVSLRRSGAAAACGYVLPQRVRSIWELGRCGEYLFALGFYKRIQNAMSRPLISSGCFSGYRTDAVRAAGGWSDSTMTEDVDLTWTFYERGEDVLFVPEAIAYPLEPASLKMLGRQLKRWSHGFIQNLIKHRNTAVRDNRLRSILSVMLWDSVTASVIYLIIVPVLAALVSPWALVIYVVDLPIVLIPVVLESRRHGLLMKAIPATLAFLVLRLVNSVYFVRAVWSELMIGNRLTVYEKGH
jgi:cellulose synthase/poly-beta-1,6-N-acetylglucosamine synthase-like glycosyltransferase